PMPEETIRTVWKMFRFPILSRLWPYLVGIGVYSALVVAFGRGVFLREGLPQERAAEAVIVGIIFGWLMSFRTQTSYKRWWEGRSLWGQLVNDSRNLHLKAAAFIPDATEREKLSALLVRFAEALRDHLRSKKSAGPHRPLAIASEV